ncbi:hypothetical protein N9F35_01620, partial [Gammaproteobacteria bacterium]|nr:hypothetical protein [Gammaproteobacteria bacterium]
MAGNPASLNKDASVQKFTGSDGGRLRSCNISSDGLRSPFAGKAGAIKPGVKEDSFKFDSVCNEL